MKKEMKGFLDFITEKYPDKTNKINMIRKHIEEEEKDCEELDLESLPRPWQSMNWDIDHIAFSNEVIEISIEQIENEYVVKIEGSIINDILVPFPAEEKRVSNIFEAMMHLESYKTLVNLYFDEKPDKEFIDSIGKGSGLRCKNVN